MRQIYHKHRRLRQVADLPAMAMALGRSWAASTTRPLTAKTEMNWERFNDIMHMFLDIRQLLFTAKRGN
eukprot:4471829-Pyramimonas_sp.AAC.1